MLHLISRLFCKRLYNLGYMLDANRPRSPF